MSTSMRTRLADASDELHEILRGWPYAFACADPCAVPSTPESRNLLQRVDDLRAIVKELTP